MERQAMKLQNVLLNLIYPPRCPVCDEMVVPFGEKICLKCIPLLQYVTPPRCCKCGKGVEEEEQEYCGDCKRGTHRYIQGRALYRYESVSAGIYRFKYGGRKEYGEFYGEEIARYLGEFIRRINPDGLIPVPLHKKRLRKRGFNQAAVLAHGVEKYTGIPVYENFVCRCRNTKPMKQLNPKERQNNLKKAFNIIGNDVKLSTVIIIDDIYTTGTTIDEMAGVLLEYGVKKLFFITLACGH